MEIFWIFLHPFICPIIPKRNKFDVTLTFKHSLLNFRTNYETMDSVFVLCPEIYKLKYKRTKNIFSEKNKYY